MRSVRYPQNRLGWRLALALTALFGAAGCRLDHYGWRPAPVSSFVRTSVKVGPACGIGITESDIELAESHYAQATDLDQRNQAGAVDHYYQAAVLVWPLLGESPQTSLSPRAWELYHSSVSKMLAAAQRHGRWNPQLGLMVQGAEGLTPVPATYHGFAWEAGDFQELAPIECYDVPSMARQFRSPGLGVPLVVVRRQGPPKPFLTGVRSFAATVVLYPPSSALLTPASGESQTPRFVLKFINPLNTDVLPDSRNDARLARDLSAPFSYPPPDDDRAWLTNFLMAGSGAKGDGLFMLEPYQPGKIPVVFIHGLLSDPRTWTSMVNELRADPALMARYQFWGFRYSTGAQFFESAAILRRQLEEIRLTYDPRRSDPAMSQMVLVGHSMGGLLAKLQVVYSGDEVWRTFADRPPSAIVATPELRDRLVRQLFFDPNPDIARVVFIGTPHRGSETATRCIGRVGAALVESAPGADRDHAQLVWDNPGVFNSEFVRRIPRSIDLMEPENPFLHATLRLPFRAGVRFHSIAGDVDRLLSATPSDGVVPLSSARLAGACSEKIVPTKHMELTGDPAVIAEVACILHGHVR